jgi:hypothetical protein
VAGRIRDGDRPRTTSGSCASSRAAVTTARSRGGRALTDVAGGSDAARDIAIASNGKIVVTGEATVDRIRRFVVARYLYS